MRKDFLPVFLVVSLMAATSAQAAKEAITPSGRPDALFQATSANDTAGKIANQCMNVGWQVQEQTSTTVVCEIPEDAARAFLDRMLVGNSYSTRPRSFARFSIAQIGDHARVQAGAWVESQMAFGQVRRFDFTDDNTYNSLIGFLVAAGGELPPGTRFSGVYVGVYGKVQPTGRTAEMVVTQVLAGSPADVAGIRVGDRIESLNGATFRDVNDLHKKESRLALGVRYPVVVRRDGADQTLTLEARERPAIGSPEDLASKAKPSPQPAPSAPPADAKQP